MLLTTAQIGKVVGLSDTPLTVRSKKWSPVDLLIIPLVLIYLVYAWAYIQRTAFTIDGVQYFVLFDDGMISMQYAHNLAEGHGLVWNAGGERVEGFSNPLWVGYMALLHLLPIEPAQMGLPVQISGMIFIALTLVFVKKIGDDVTGNPWPGLAAAGLTAFYLPLHNWALQGMEVSILALMVTVAAWQAIRTAKNGRFRSWLYLLLGLATLVRIDMVVPFIVIVAYLVWMDAPNRQRHLLWGLATLVFFLGGQTLLRFWYYGEWLPNTYYLKVVGAPVWFRVAHGLAVYWQFLWTTNWVLYVLPLAVMLLTWDKSGLLLVGLFLAQSAYSIYVGGDAWEHRGGANRFIAIAMPVFFIAFSASLYRLRLKMAAERPAWQRVALAAAELGFLGVSFFSLNVMIESNYVERLLFMRQPLFVRGTERATSIGLYVRAMTTEQARVAVVTAGAIPYFSERYAIDLMGKNDPVIARLDSRIKISPYGILEFRPGHSKWDYAYSIAELKPDVVAQLWDETTPEAAPYLEGIYTRVVIDDIPIYLRDDSPYILWDVAAQLGQ
jgi:hypothetical protein